MNMSGLILFRYPVHPLFLEKFRYTTNKLQKKRNSDPGKAKIVSYLIWRSYNMTIKFDAWRLLSVTHSSYPVI